ncbi:MAG: tyrosine--tRNA ligase [Vallitaleaceae bacterium]|nr:tyrosine--tRNA ligase [Vallitaleaceae bacterium]
MFSVIEQLKIIKKGSLEIIEETELISKLERSIASGKPLVIKLGLDPSAPDIHLGHAVVLRKIKQLQDLGHQAIIIIGDFTGRIGDPTGKSKTRKQLTETEVLKNADTYKTQIDRILDPNKTTMLFNSTWLSQMTFVDLIELSSKHTLARMLEREDFKNRFASQQPIGIHELFYPLMQGYDSLEIEADIELGGTDQRFNILMGRDMQNKEGKEKQIALFMPLLEGLDGIEKMSKSLGNYVGIMEDPIIQYEKIMTLPDTLVLKYFELATDLHPDKIETIRIGLENGSLHPKTVKMQLANEIVLLYHGSAASNEAEAHFIKVFSKLECPDRIPIITCMPNTALIDVLVMGNLVKSKSEGRRLIVQSGVKLNEELITDFHFNALNENDVIRVGRNKFLQIKYLHE